MASLDLPVLPSGWTWEGWVVADGQPISTGRFLAPDAVDDDGTGPAAGPDPGPPFPGQDFIDPALDLIGRDIVVTVEPEPDVSPAPFTLKPLSDRVEDVGAGVLQSLATSDTSRSPRGLVLVL